jgi:uncharacterized protein (TIGR02996 family)
MTPDPDRLAFLRAIASSPDDDTPRLVFADWLDEHAAADADRARAEFLRLSCRSRPKARITKAEQDWLAEHWRRLVPATSARLAALGAKPDHQFWSGRYLDLLVFHKRDAVVELKLEFWRGFVRRAVYISGFEEVAGAVSADDPLARHEIAPFLNEPRLGQVYFMRVSPNQCFGRAVWDRIAGHTSVVDHPHNPVKHFEQRTGTDARKKLKGRVYDAVAAAMTARARELAGWPADPPTLGE